MVGIEVSEIACVVRGGGGGTEHEEPNRPMM